MKMKQMQMQNTWMLWVVTWCLRTTWPSIFPSGLVGTRGRATGRTPRVSGVERTTQTLLIVQDWTITVCGEDGDLLEYANRHLHPRASRQSLALLRLEVPAEVRAHQRRGLGLRRQACQRQERLHDCSREQLITLPLHREKLERTLTRNCSLCLNEAEALVLCGPQSKLQ